MKTEKQVRTIEFTTMKTEQHFHVVYHMEKCDPEIFTKQQDWKFILHEDHLAIVAELESRVTKMRSVFEKILNEGVDTSTDGGMNFVKEALAEDDVENT